MQIRKERLPIPSKEEKKDIEYFDRYIYGNVRKEKRRESFSCVAIKVFHYITSKR